jgi:hypothetical protein
MFSMTKNFWMVVVAVALVSVSASPVMCADWLGFSAARAQAGAGADEFVKMAENGNLETAEGFVYIEIDQAPDRPAFIHARDIDGDGHAELIVSKFAGSSPMGSGYVDLYKKNDPLDLKTWNKTRLLEGIKFPNNISTQDINGDGKLDIIVPAGFLATAPQKSGTLLWLEQTAKGFKTHTLIGGAKYFYHHAEFVDLDGDSIKDLVTVGEEKGMFNEGSAQAHFFRGTGSGDFFEKTPVKIADGLGSLPTVVDFDGDGDLDIASAEYFGSKGSFAWLENLGGNKWRKNYIDDKAGKAIQLSIVENLYGDGRTVLVGANHTNTSDNSSDAESAVFVYEKSTQYPGQFIKTQISRGIKSRKSPAVGPQGAPGVFGWGDVDGDGLIDIVVHGDGDPGVYLLRQSERGRFETLILAKNMPQGGVAVADIDGDGVCEAVVSSYENNKLMIYDHINN